MSQKNYLKHFLSLTLIATLMLMNSCALKKPQFAGSNISYSGTVYLTNGEQKSGRVRMPSPSDKAVSIIEHDEIFLSSDIERIELNVPGSTDKVKIMSYMPVKAFLKKTSYYWLLCVGKGDFVTAYVGAEGYIINADGSITLEGTRQVINHGNGTAVIQPSFPVYMMKTGGDALVLVAAKGGVSFEGSSFRSGVSNFLADDTKLCEYIRQEKWDFDNIATIAENYDPYRREKDLTIDGETVVLNKKGLITNDFNNEMTFYTEIVIPPGDMNGTQFGIGLHLTSCKFLTYGGDIGFASAKYVDYLKRLDNHGINNMATAPVTEADFSKSSLFRFNAFAGVQLPLSVKKMYFVPAANFTFGGLTGTDYSTLLYGPMATLDIGYRFRRGNILMLGGGYRRNISLKSQESKDQASAPGFEAFKPYNSLMLRVLYKF